MHAWLSGSRLDKAINTESVPQPSRYEPAFADRTMALDPGLMGPWETTASGYSLDAVSVPDLPLKVPTIGHVVAPVGAPGPRPLVLFMHGRHPSCYLPGTTNAQLIWPCPQGWEPTPNELGYRYLQELLASQGYVTVSIAANAIDGQETFDAPDFGASARAALVRHHLSIWADWVADPSSPWSDRVDMSSVTLVGHSRGGEGVNRVGIVAPTTPDYSLDGLVLLAPTNFGRQAAPGIPTVTLVGYCDGDVTDLAGQGYTDIGRDFPDDASLRSSVLVMGANHNYFNTEWTPGLAEAFAEDDWRDPNDPICAPGEPTRLTASAQRDVASTYVAGAVRLFAQHDDQMLPLFDGSRVHVPSAGDADVRSSAVGGQRQLVAMRRDLVVSASGPVQARMCVGQSSGPAGVCGEGYQPEQAPHWPRGDQTPFRPGQSALELAWSGSDGAATVQLGAPLDISSHTSVDARVIVDPTSPRVRLSLRLTDADGASVDVVPRDRGRLSAFPGTEPLGKLLAQTLRARLGDVTGVDLSRITSLGLVSRSQQGRVWLLDVAGRSPGLATPSSPDIPVIRVIDVRQPEGSASDPQQVEVTVAVRGAVSESTPVAVRAVSPQDGRLLRRTTVIFEPGQSSATFTVPIERDDRDDFPATFGFDTFAFTKTGDVVTGDYAARVTIRDDDAAPTVTFSRAARTASEGSNLRWQVRLSEPVDYFTAFGWKIVRNEGDAPSLRSNDVPAAWLRSFGIRPPQRAVPLWRLDRLRGFIFLDPGRTRGSVRIPTVVDGRNEGREVVSLQVNGEILKVRPSTRPIGVRDS